MFVCCSIKQGLRFEAKLYKYRELGREESEIRPPLRPLSVCRDIERKKERQKEYRCQNDSFFQVCVCVCEREREREGERRNKDRKHSYLRRLY